jgi:hypothetical protein
VFVKNYYAARTFIEAGCIYVNFMPCIDIRYKVKTSDFIFSFLNFPFLRTYSAQTYFAPKHRRLEGAVKFRSGHKFQKQRNFVQDMIVGPHFGKYFG